MSARLEKIVKIEKVGTTNNYVYDIEVEDNHNFLANDIFVHNTDSVFCQYTGHDEDKTKVFEELLLRVNIAICNYVKQFNPNIPVRPDGTCGVRMSFDYLYSCLSLFGIKKRYIGLRLMDGKEILWFRGVEIVRKDTPDEFKSFLTEFFTAYLKRKSEPELKALLRDMRLRIRQIDMKKLGIAKNFGTNEDDYKNNPQHLRAFKWSNDRLGLGLKVTDFIKMMFIKKTPKYDSDVMCFSNPGKIPPDIEVDHERYFQFFILNKVDEILNVEDIRKGLVNLSEFMGNN
jgi:DNA polymerase elongation subunit (family B)